MLYVNIFLLALVLLTAPGCALMQSQQSRYSFLGDPCLPRPESADVEIFRSGVPSRPFERISRLDVHIEKTHFLSCSFEEIMSELKRQALRSGADAIIEVEEKRSMLGETHIYHVAAIGVRYKKVGN